MEFKKTHLGIKLLNSHNVINEKVQSLALFAGFNLFAGSAFAVSAARPDLVESSPDKKFVHEAPHEVPGDIISERKQERCTQSKVNCKILIQNSKKEHLIPIPKKAELPKFSRCPEDQFQGDLTALCPLEK